jgi:hypothetical protein
MQVGLTDAERIDLIQAVERGMTELGEGKPSANDSTETVTNSPTEPSTSAKIGPAVLNKNQPSLRRRAAYSPIIFCIGVAATLGWFCFGVAETLGWQSYRDAIREMIASSYRQLGRLVPQTVDAETIPEMTSRIARDNAAKEADLAERNKAWLNQMSEKVDACLDIKRRGLVLPPDCRSIISSFPQLGARR